MIHSSSSGNAGAASSSSTIITIKQESIPVDSLTTAAGSYVDSTTFLPGSPVSSQMVNPNLVQSSTAAGVMVASTASISAGDLNGFRFLRVA